MHWTPNWKAYTNVSPSWSGSNYYNYKEDFSVVILALVNAYTEFMYVDVSTQGHISNGFVWGKSTFKAILESGNLSIPKAFCKYSSSIGHCC